MVDIYNSAKRKIYFREYWRKNRVHKTELWRKSHSKPEVKANKRKYNIKWKKNNPDKVKANRRKHILKARARDKFRYAIKTGKIIRQPCEVCKLPNAHGHHTDYSKPFDVKWLCVIHHMMEHRTIISPSPR